MKKPITSALVIAAACFGTWATLPSKSVLAADDNAMSRQADQELADALARGDKGAVAALLDENFLWVEADGTIHTKAQVVEDLAPLAIDNEGATDVRTLNLVGSAERVLGIHHNQRFAHMWVKRSSRWQAFVFLDIPIPAKRRENIAGARPPAGADRDCVNPCSTVPYKPENAAQEGALAAWFHLKNDEWHPNPEDWAAHADDSHETITPAGDLPKLRHVAELAQQRKLYGEHGGSPGEPVLSMRMFDFGGNVVIQEALQGRNGPAMPNTWIFRVFVNRGDGWKIALSAQTRIKRT